MAKKEVSKSNSSMMTLMNKIFDKHDPKGSVIDAYTPISDENAVFVHTGSYMMNAHFSGSIRKGVPMGKIVTVCGEPKAGKSFVLLNICREVQKIGYYPVYIETEFSHDKKRFELQGIDTANARITQPTTVEDLIVIVNPLIEECMKVYNAIQLVKDEAKRAERIENEIPKICFFLDSRSGLLSGQQLKSFSDGDPKANMGTDIQTYDNFMKSITINLGKLGWGFIVASHTKIEEVKVQGKSFTKRRPKGGYGQIYMSSAISMMWKKDERDDEDKSKIVGINVTMDVFESRYVKHRQISFFLPNDRPMNPLDGLMEYVTWETCQIAKGKWIEVFNVHAKLVAKKMIGVDSKNFTAEMLKSLSKADQEYIEEIMQWLHDNKFVTATGGDKGNIWTLTKKYEQVIAGETLGFVAIHNPGSPKFIAGHLTNQYFTFEELMENKDGKIFTDEVLDKIDVYIRADFEIGEKSKLGESTETNGKEADYFD